MPLVANPRIIFNEIPAGLPSADRTLLCDETATIDIEHTELSGGILVKVLALSLDPYMRNRMRPLDTPGDMPVFPLGDV